jgi:hypothetical protein
VSVPLYWKRGTAILRRLIDVMYWLSPLTLRFLRGFPLDQ